jgi:hypothetical protein
MDFKKLNRYSFSHFDRYAHVSDKFRFKTAMVDVFHKVGRYS